MLIQLPVEVPVATWLRVKAPDPVAVTVVEGRMLTPCTPMPGETPAIAAQVTLVELTVVPICATMRVAPPPMRLLTMPCAPVT